MVTLHRVWCVLLYSVVNRGTMEIETVMTNPNARGFCLVAAFLAMEPINVLISIARELGGGLITKEVQLFIHEQCINNKVCRNHPPSQLYVKHLLKQIILVVESESLQVLDAFYEQYVQYLTSSKDLDLSQSIEKCYRSFMFILPAGMHVPLAWHDIQNITESKIMTVTLRSSVNMLEGGTGCCIWPSSLFLSEFILSHPKLFSSKCCLEVGSGIGLVGICLANVKASKVILSDGDLSTLANMKHNMEINDLTSEGMIDHLVECRHLAWESASEDELIKFGAEVILGADVIYDPSCVTHLVRVLAALLRTKDLLDKDDRNAFKLASSSKPNNTTSETGSKGSVTEHEKLVGICKDKSSNCVCYKNVYPVAYIASVIRNIDTYNCFLRLASDAGLTVVDVTQTIRPVNLLPYLSSFDRSVVHLYRIEK